MKPEAKSYYELAAATLKFIFPKPGILVGVSSKDREIVNMKGVCFRSAPSLEPFMPRRTTSLLPFS